MEVGQPINLKKTHSSRPVGGAEMGRAAGGERTRGNSVTGGLSEVVDSGTGQARLQLADPTRWWLADPAAPHSRIDKPRGLDSEWQRTGQAVRQVADPEAPHSCIDKPGKTVGEQSRPRNPGLQHGEIKPQTSD